MDISSLKTDLDAAEEGIYFPFSEDCSIKIAQWNNKLHNKFLRKLRQIHGRRIDADAVSDTESNQLLSDQWQFIVRGWKGMTEDGKPLKYSPKVIKDLSLNPQYKGFFKQITAISAGEENFRVEAVKSMGES